MRRHPDARLTPRGRETLASRTGSGLGALAYEQSRLGVARLVEAVFHVPGLRRIAGPRVLGQLLSLIHLGSFAVERCRGESPFVYMPLMELEGIVPGCQLELRKPSQIRNVLRFERR